MSLLIALLLAAGPTDNTATAREHFKSAQLHYSLGEFDEAVKEFREAYRLRQEPAILFNVAQCYRQMRMWKDAYFNYRQYLNLAKKDAPNREEAESLAGQMRKRMDEEEEQKTRIARDPAAAHNGEATLAAASLPPQEPPLLVQQQPPAQQGGGMKATRIAGYAALGAGVVAGGLAFVFHGSAQSSADQFNQKYASGSLTPADAQLRDDANSKGKTATLCAVGAAALVVTGAVLAFAF